MIHKIKNYINGALQDYNHEKMISITSPIDGKKIAVCPDSEIKDLKMAIDSASKASQDWRNISYFNK